MTAFNTADILLPRLSAEGMTKWCVDACDQHTSEPEYWQQVEQTTAGSPSAYELILPEAYLGGDCSGRIAAINANMRRYLADGLFECHSDCLIYIKRTQSDGKLREGLIGVIDLEMYDYSKGSKSQVRATEATVAERIPPRVKIRENAALELPHIMILIDDPDKTVIEPLAGLSLQKLYDFPLMMGGGRLEGYKLEGAQAGAVLAALDKLGDKQVFNRRYGLSDEEVLLYAMGDGNHSLATAKACYEKKKSEGSPDAALQRYALVELVNLHSPALEFEAIHRVVCDVDAKALTDFLTETLGLESGAEGDQRVKLVLGGETRELVITKPTANLAVGSLQAALDDFLAKNGGKIDYIHGEDVLRKLCAAENTVGFLLEPMTKPQLFPTVIKDGALPRKTFSMGCADDKRFYCEARRITLD